MRFKYRAIKTSGETYEGTAEAKDRFEVFKQIRESGGEILSIQEINKEKTVNFEKIVAILNRVKTYDKIMLARNLGAMLNAGLAISRALDVFERQTRNSAFKKTVWELKSCIESGKSFSAALGEQPKIFSQLFVSMARAGEESGSLPHALENIANQMEQVNELKKKVRGAMAYPTIVILAMFGVGALMFVQVVPTLSQVFKDLNAELPASTKAIIAISDFVSKNGILTGVLAAGLIVLIILVSRLKKSKKIFHFIFLHTPIIGGIVKEVNSARTTRTLSALLAAGVPVVGAIEITRDVVQNFFFKNVLIKAQEKVQKGAPIAEVFRENEHLYPPFVSEMISVGEETGSLSQMLDRTAEFYEAEVARKTKNLSTIIEPFLMVFIGIGVGFFAVAMIKPIYSLTANL